MRTFIILICICLSATIAYAQVEVPTADKERKLSIGIDIGYPILNFNQALEKAMIDQAFDVPVACFLFCEGWIEHPHSNTAPYVGLDISYLLNHF